MDFQIDQKKLNEIMASPEGEAGAAAPPHQTEGGYEFQIDQEKLKGIVSEPEGILDTFGSWVSGAAKGVKEAFTGPENLKYKGAPDIVTALEEELPTPVSGFVNPFSEKYAETMRSDALKALSQIKLVRWAAQSDKALTGIVRKALGDRFIRLEDDNGYPVVIYRGKDGSEKAAYVNKPGLDYQDIELGVEQTVPYLVGGGALGSAIVRPTTGAIGGAFGWGLAEGTTSLSMDAIAKAAGSDESLMTMLKRSGLAAAGGAAGDVAQRMLTGFTAWLKANKYVEDGNLSTLGAQRLKELGLDPYEVQGAIDKGLINPREIAADMTRPVKTTEGVMDDAGRIIRNETDYHPFQRKYEAKTAGIDLTTGEATKNKRILLEEEAYSAGEFGSDAETAMRRVLGPRGSAEVQAHRMEEGARKTLYPDIGIERTTPVEAGNIIQDSVQSGYKRRMDWLDKKMAAVPDVKPEKLMQGEITGYIDKIAGVGTDKRSPLKLAIAQAQSGNPNLRMKNSAAAIRLLQKYEQNLLKDVVPTQLTGKAAKKAMKEAEPQSIITTRNALMNLRDNAYKNNKQDYAATAKIIEAFDDWVADNADRFGAGELEDYIMNMDFRHKVKSKFFGDKKNPGGEWIRKMVDSGDLNPSRIVTDLTGSSKDSISRVKALQRALGKNSREMKLVKGIVLSKAFYSKSGKPHDIGRIAEEIEKLRANDGVFNHLFTKSDRKKLNTFLMKAKSLDRLPPGKKKGKAKKFLKETVEFIARKFGTRETFHGRPFRGSMWHALARYMASKPSIGAIARGRAASKADRYSRGVLPIEAPRDPQLPYAGASMAQEYADEENL